MHNIRAVLIVILICRYYAHVWRRQGQWMPLWKKGEETIKQPVFVSDLAAGIIAAIKDSDTAGKTYQAVG